LIAQLGDDQWKKRQAAESGLAEIGALISPRLKQVSESATDEEVRGRAEAALATIDQNRHFGATPIYLDAHNQPLKQVVDEMLDQAEAPADWTSDSILGSATWPAVTLQARGQSFWSVVQQIQQQTGLDAADWHPSSPQQMGWFSGGGGIASVDGPFMIVAYQLELHRMRLLGGAVAPLTPQQMGGFPGRGGGLGLGRPQPQGLMLTCVVLSEPKIRGAAAAPAARWTIKSAQDDQGDNLNSTPDGNFIYGTAWRSAWPLRLEMACPPGTAHTLHNLSGQFTIMAEAGFEQIDITDPLHAQTMTRTIGGREFVIHPLEKTPNMAPGFYELEVEIPFHPNEAQDWQDLRTMTTRPEIDLLDADGESRYSMFRTSAATNGTSYTCHFEFTLAIKPGMPMGQGLAPVAEANPPARLVWRIPTGSKPIDGHFDFRDLPLP
jgi:hypothetical protein